MIVSGVIVALCIVNSGVFFVLTVFYSCRLSLKLTLSKNYKLYVRSKQFSSLHVIKAGNPEQERWAHLV